MGDEEITVGVLYPAWLHTDPAEQHREVAKLADLDPRVSVVVEPYVDSSAARTRRSSPDFQQTSDDFETLTDAQLAAMERMDVALALDLPLNVRSLAPRLAWVQAVGSGIGQLRSAGLGCAGIRLTNAAGTSAQEIAEFVLARVLEHWKRLPELADAAKARRWQPLYGRPVTGCTIGLVGLGAINTSVARMARALGFRVLASRRNGPLDHPDVDHVYQSEQITELVAACDVVVAALPETPETMGLFDARLFAAMSPGTFFCNVGRGSAVVEQDLLAAVTTGHLGGAALDVFDDEPLPPTSPLWDRSAISISAHCSSVPAASIQRTHELFRSNITSYLHGQPLRNEVDLVRGY